MVLPKWTVVCMLCVCALSGVSVGTALWIAWPAITATDFVGLISAGQYHEATRMIQEYEEYRPEDLRRVLSAVEPDSLKLAKRSNSDILRGKLTFVLLSGRGSVTEFHISRNRITSFGKIAPCRGEEPAAEQEEVFSRE